MEWVRVVESKFMDGKNYLVGDYTKIVIQK